MTIENSAVADATAPDDSAGGSCRDGAAAPGSIAAFRDRITAITTRAIAIIATQSAADIAELAQLRAEMARMLDLLSRFVHRQVFVPQIGRGAEGRQARVLKAECILLSEDYRAFVSRWRMADVTRSWPEYAPAAAAFRQRIMAHVEAVAALV